MMHVENVSLALPLAKLLMFPVFDQQLCELSCSAVNQRVLHAFSALSESLGTESKCLPLRLFDPGACLEILKRGGQSVAHAQRRWVHNG